MLVLSKILSQDTVHLNNVTITLFKEVFLSSLFRL